MDKKEKSGGLTFFEALQIMFIGFKLAGIIAWEWPVVMLPTIVTLALYVALLAAYAVDRKRKKRRWKE